jgi:hypothetical protein
VASAEGTIRRAGAGRDQGLRRYSYFEYLGINTHFSWVRDPCECSAAVELTVGREVLPGGYPGQCSNAQRAGDPSRAPARSTGGADLRRDAEHLALVVLRSPGVHGTAPNRCAVGPIRFPNTGCPGPPAFRSLPFLRPNAGDNAGPVGPALCEPLQRPARLSASPPSLENDSF